MSPSTTIATCPRCEAPYPDVARFCARCGADVRGGDVKRRGAFAADPSEPLLAVDVVSSLMPMAGRNARQTFKWALLIGLGIAAVAGAIGFLPFALAAAAVTVPLVYILYLYDVNEWEDQPVPVLVGTLALAGALGLGFTLLWQDVILDGGLASFRPAGSGYFVETKVLLVVGLLVPFGLLVLAQLGPIWLVLKRRFDDLIDGLTFGIASGVAFATLETFVLNNSVLFDGPGRIESPDAAVWVSIIVVGGLLKPVIYGSAVGLAVASFSGKGDGVDGFGPDYVRGSVEAFVGLVAYEVGLYLLGRLGGSLGVLLGLVWALIVAVVLVLRVRILLHTALIEAGLEAQARGEIASTANKGIGFCGECEMPLLHDASFCSACGASVRAASKITRRANADAAGATQTPTTVVWESDAGPPPPNRKSAAVMIGASIALVALIGGIFAAINAGTQAEPSEKELGGLDVTGQGRSSVPFQLGGGDDDEPGKGGGKKGTTTTVPEEEEPVDKGRGVAITVPDGWEVLSNEGGDTILATRGAVARVLSVNKDIPADVDAVALMKDYADNIISEEVTDVTGKLRQVQPPESAPSVADAASLTYEGFVAVDQQSIAIEGIAIALITEERFGVVIETSANLGQWESSSDDFDIIFNSVLQSLPA